MTEANATEGCVLTPGDLAAMGVDANGNDTTTGPDSTAARTDRLAAAEDDTGFKLHARIKIKGSNHGVLQVVGFARINVPGIDTPIRCVVVADPSALQQHGVETCIVVTPDTLAPASAPSV